MSKRARQMALMGFVSGALQDVARNRENRRLEEADARKEARLAAIRSEERRQDFAQRRELTQYEFGERRAMAAEELAGRMAVADMEIKSRERISAADNKSRERAASIGARPARDTAAKLETYIDDAGKSYTVNTNDPASVRQFMELSGRVNLRPDYASRATNPYGANPAVPTMVPQSAAAGPARISSPTELASLPSGTRFVAPDGSLRVKP
ncbi:hypothetical protein [Thermomonas sp. XSG]|uniref:hypothetical protein n=1 Tax=Thermomonas sp. XSG TaxID=2771436 RepID=UPI0016801E87|nr:hypothetical protein [Thermomonas sp. XSG]QNU16015.1 hypothetical protein ICG51_002440 [Thermomonas sp. XSG]